MVPIFEYIVAVRWCDVEIWILCQWEHFILSSPTCSMVKYHINNHCNSTFVAFVNQSFKRFRCAVCFVECEVVGRVVAPRNVAFEFADRHKFDCVYTEIFDIIQAFCNCVKRAEWREVVSPNFINNQVVFIRTFKVECSI